MSEQPCYRNNCPNEAVARITLIGGRVLGTMTVDLCLTHYYEAVQAIVGQPITAGAIPREEHKQSIDPPDIHLDGVKLREALLPHIEGHERHEVSNEG